MLTHVSRALQLFRETRNPVPIRDLHATIFTAMGISPRTAFDVERRPFYATEDGHGRAVQALFA